MSKQTWKDTLPSVDEPTLVDAADNIAGALVAHLDDTLGFMGSKHATYAAAHIRAYRKTLDVKSERCESLDEDMTREELLWSAMSHLCYAGLFHDDEAKYTAAHLRAAEANLRELWKQGQA